MLTLSIRLLDCFSDRQIDPDGPANGPLLGRGSGRPDLPELLIRNRGTIRWHGESLLE